MEIKNIKDIKLNPNNPRIIKDDKFKKLVESVKSFPEMLDIRPIVCTNDSKQNAETGSRYSDKKKLITIHNNSELTKKLWEILQH